MLDEKTRALLGDRAAQERITKRGELLPCPFCGAEPTTRVRVKAKCLDMVVICFKCGTSKVEEVENSDAEFNRINNGMIGAAKKWNTRAPLLTPTQMAVLERETEGEADETK